MFYQGIAKRAVAVTPSDSTNLGETLGLYVGTTGNISAEMSDGTDCLFSNVPVGFMPISVKKVNATSTTASDIVALYGAH